MANLPIIHLLSHLVNEKPQPRESGLVLQAACSPEQHQWAS